MAHKASRTSIELLTNSFDELKLTSKRRGFTIVELLTVIVVIAILAAITVVAVTGTRDRANLSALQSELSGQARQLAVYRAQNNDQLPATLAAARTAGMLNNNGATKYTAYATPSSGRPTNYCATAQRGVIAYSVISTSSTPVAGSCGSNLANDPGSSPTLVAFLSAMGCSREDQPADLH